MQSYRSIFRLEVADVFDGVAVRDLKRENINAHAGNKNARPTAIGRANYFRNQKDDTRKESFITNSD